MKLCKNYIQIKIWHHVIINWQEKKQFSILIKVSDYHDVRSDHLRSAMTHASETFYANDKGRSLGDSYEIAVSSKFWFSISARMSIAPVALLK